jgi:DnaK suppressor protein
MEPERARELLRAERERLERALARFETENNEDLADVTDSADRATDLFQEELDAGLTEDLREQLAAVERAEERLAAGTYGLSIESGEPIPDERLEVVPTAERTVAEEQRRGR